MENQLSSIQWDGTAKLAAITLLLILQWIWILVWLELLKSHCASQFRFHTLIEGLINLDHQPNAMRTVPASSPVSVGYGLNPFRPVIRSTQVNLNFGWWAESTTACYCIHSRWFGYWAIFGLQISGTWFVQFEGSALQFALLLISNMLNNVPLVEVTRVKPCTWQHEKRDC